MLFILFVFVDPLVAPFSLSPAMSAASTAATVPASVDAPLPKWKDPPGEARKPTKEELLLTFVFAEAKEGDVNSVIDTIDRFCHKDNQWMMNGQKDRGANTGWGQDNPRVVVLMCSLCPDAIVPCIVFCFSSVGDVKGVLLDTELTKKKPKHVVELGGYMGYSALRISRQLAPGAHLTSVEISPINAAFATKIIEFAGCRDKVTVVVGTAETKIEALKKLGPIDLLFLDHLKTVYKSDLQLLERAGLIQPGTVVVADNCLVPGCPDYVEYVMNAPHFDSIKHVTTLEYCDDTDWVIVSTRK